MDIIAPSNTNNYCWMFQGTCYWCNSFGKCTAISCPHRTIIETSDHTIAIKPKRTSDGTLILNRKEDGEWED